MYLYLFFLEQGERLIDCKIIRLNSHMHIVSRTTLVRNMISFHNYNKWAFILLLFSAFCSCDMTCCFISNLLLLWINHSEKSFLMNKRIRTKILFNCLIVLVKVCIYLDFRCDNVFIVKTFMYVFFATILNMKLSFDVIKKK